MTTVIDASGLARTFTERGRTVHALRSATLTVRAGERVVVTGPSGAGKSTLLNLLGLLDRPTSGEYRLLGRSTTSMLERQRDQLRRERLGFVFQAYHVLGNRTVADNVLLKLAAARIPRRDRAALIEHALDDVALLTHASALGRTLSGGEKQRLAIARAVVTRPAVVLADEPTGNLDPANAEGVLAMLSALAAPGIAVVVITHDPVTASWADRSCSLRGGVVDDS